MDGGKFQKKNWTMGNGPGKKLGVEIEGKVPDPRRGEGGVTQRGGWGWGGAVDRLHRRSARRTAFEPEFFEPKALRSLLIW